MMNTKEVLTQWFTHFLIKSEIMSNYEIAEELRKSFIIRFEN